MAIEGDCEEIVRKELDCAKKRLRGLFEMTVRLL
jgi:hypothetical protein